MINCVSLDTISEFTRLVHGNHLKSVLNLLATFARKYSVRYFFS